MTKFTVPATILQRFIALEAVKIEINSGKCYIIGSNNTIACVEYLNETDQEDDSCYININKVLIDDKNIDGLFTFETIPELAMGSVVDDKGQNYIDFISWPDESPLDKWRDWFKLSTESNGFMYWNLEQIETLWKTSPSGEIVFPKIINATEPVIVRDVNNANWLGVFIPAVDGKAVIKPATLPEWL